MNWRTARILRILSALDFFMSAILICDCRSQVFSLCHIFQGFTRYHCSMIFPAFWARNTNIYLQIKWSRLLRNTFLTTVHTVEQNGPQSFSNSRKIVGNLVLKSSTTPETHRHHCATNLLKKLPIHHGDYHYCNWNEWRFAVWYVILPECKLLCSFNIKNYDF